MQSKARAQQRARTKTLFFTLVLVCGAVLVFAMLHEPKLVQTPVEQALDASQFKQ